MKAPIGGAVALAMLLRSLLIQASWNYRTLLGTGFAFALLPALRRLYPDHAALERAVRRHTVLFNSHPYLSPMALGAVARLEAEGESEAVIERFKTAVRGSLGTLGDRLIWAGWRPVCLLAALSLFATGVAGWIAALGFLLLYNAGHIGLRIWSLRLGLQSGKAVGERLRESPILPAQRLLGTAGAFLVGLLLPAVVVGGFGEWTLPREWVIAAAVAAIAGIRLGERVRLPVLLILALFTIIGFLFGLIQ